MDLSNPLLGLCGPIKLWTFAFICNFNGRFDQDYVSYLDKLRLCPFLGPHLIISLPPHSVDHLSDFGPSVVTKFYVLDGSSSNWHFKLVHNYICSHFVLDCPVDIKVNCVWLKAPFWAQKCSMCLELMQLWIVFLEVNLRKRRMSFVSFLFSPTKLVETQGLGCYNWVLRLSQRVSTWVSNISCKIAVRLRIFIFFCQIFPFWKEKLGA